MKFNEPLSTKRHYIAPDIRRGNREGSGKEREEEGGRKGGRWRQRERGETEGERREGEDGRRRMKWICYCCFWISGSTRITTDISAIMGVVRLVAPLANYAHFAWKISQIPEKS